MENQGLAMSTELYREKHHKPKLGPIVGNLKDRRNRLINECARLKRRTAAYRAKKNELVRIEAEIFRRMKSG